MSTTEAIVQPKKREYARVLDLDAGLRGAIPPEKLEAARRHLVAIQLTAEVGPWNATAPCDDDALGLLVLKGLLTRDVEVAGTQSHEILGAGDLIRPWDDDAELSAVPLETSWQILVPTKLAVLDRRFTDLAGRWPELGAEVIHRILRRLRWLAILLAIANARGVEEKVLLLLWHLASNWGRVTPRGTLMPFPLTHEVIADLVGARRPSVTTAISALHQKGELERVDEGWLLPVEPPRTQPADGVS